MSRSGIPGWSSASCFLRAAQTPALGTQSGTDAPHPHLTPPGISTPRAWPSGILAVCPDEDSKASQVGSQREQSKVKHYLMLIPPLSPPHPSAMSVDTVPWTPRQVLLEAPGHPSFCVHHLCLLGQGSVLLSGTEELLLICMCTGVGYQQRNE